MRLCTYSHHGAPAIGVVGADGHVVSAAETPYALGTRAPLDMLDLIRRWDELGPALQASQEADRGQPVGHVDGLAMLPPVQPSKVLGVALNNKALGGAADSISSNPMFFAEPSSAMVGHGAAIEVHPSFGLTHPEPELGVIIGRDGRHISPDAALDHVFGYTVVDDVTSVGLKSEDSVVFTRAGADALKTPGGDGAAPGFVDGALHLTYHARSKGTDTFLPVGPWVSTRDEVTDPDALSVRMHLDGELCFDDGTANLRFGVAQVVSFASRYFTLRAGDLLHTGSAATGAYRLRDIDYLACVGSTRTIEIAGVGLLSNPIAAATGSFG